MSKLQLQYSTEPRRRSKRVILICAAGLLLLISCGVFLIWVENIIRWKIPFLRAQTACMNWVGPAGQVAYEEDPAKAQQLSNGRRSGAGFTTLLDNIQIEAFYSKVDLINAFGLQIADSDEAILFLHGRRAKGGQPRLICVRASNFFPLRYAARRSMASWDQAGLEFAIVQPRTLTTQPLILKHSVWSDPMFGDITPKPTRIFFGVPDPVDESKFSILFQTPTEAKVIQGRLMPDDTLQFEVAAGPDSMAPGSATTHP